MIFKVLLRTGIVLLSAVLFTAASVHIVMYNLSRGESPEERDTLVLAAEQRDGAAKWVSELFFGKEVTGKILAASAVAETLQVSDLLPVQPTPEPYVTISAVQPEPTPEPPPDPWDNAVDGMLLETYLGITFKAYILLVKDPSRVYTAKPAWGYGYDKSGLWIFELMKNDNVVAAINAGAFYDPGGVGAGGVPLGITYSQGKCVWDDGDKLSFVGIDNNDRLIARTSMTQEEADRLGIRDGVCFQVNNVLISSEDGNVTPHYNDKDTSLAQRTAIGQTGDGTMILMVTEGRTAAYLGANRRDIIDTMLNYGAVTAAMLDGGSSTVMCYPDYYEYYDYDEYALNNMQKRGLINAARAFMNPRLMPTYFAVTKS